LALGSGLDTLAPPPIPGVLCPVSDIVEGRCAAHIVKGCKESLTEVLRTSYPWV
jgi:hypothetical protein